MLLVLLALAAQEAALLPGERKVVSDSAPLYEGPSRVTRLLKKAAKGESLRVVAVEWPWAKVELADGRFGYLLAAAFIPRAPDEGGLRADPKALTDDTPVVETRHASLAELTRIAVASLLLRGRIDEALQRLRDARDAGAFGRP